MQQYYSDVSDKNFRQAYISLSNPMIRRHDTEILIVSASLAYNPRTSILTAKKKKEEKQLFHLNYSCACSIDPVTLMLQKHRAGKSST